jgi:hypothetical protein
MVTIVESRAARILRSILSPEIPVRAFIRRFGIGSLEFRLAMQSLERPQYAFGVRQAIYLASRLGLKRVGAIEFGVGGGEGLLALEDYAIRMGRQAGIDVEVYGFDTGSGLPIQVDYRDLPHVWQPGHYEMNVEALEKKLKLAKLYIGDVRETVSDFLAAGPAPLGFISFDLDYYSSTMSAFRLFEGRDEHFLPRVVCYFDDLPNDGGRMTCPYTGELLAINEFNDRDEPHHKICPWGLWELQLSFYANWNQQMYVYHRFRHPQYTTYIC